MIWRSIWDSVQKKSAVGVAQLAVCLAYMKPLVGSLALHKFAVTSTPKIPGLGKNQNSATPFESEANFGFQTSSQNKGGLKWRLTQQVRALAALKEFPEHTSGSTQLPVTPAPETQHSLWALAVPAPIWCRCRWAGVHTYTPKQSSQLRVLCLAKLFCKTK